MYTAQSPIVRFPTKTPPVRGEVGEQAVLDLGGVIGGGLTPPPIRSLLRCSDGHAPYGDTQVRVTGLDSPPELLAVQWKIRVSTGWKISSVMPVSVRTGFTPVQLAFGQPAALPDTVASALKVLAFVWNVRFPFLMAALSMNVGTVDGPSRTLFWPGERLPPPFWHW